jgi:hypothetical protein
VVTLSGIAYAILCAFVMYRLHKKIKARRMKRRYDQRAWYLTQFAPAVESSFQHPSKPVESDLDRAFRQAWIEPAEMTCARIDAILHGGHEPIIGYLSLQETNKELHRENEYLRGENKALRQALRASRTSNNVAWMGDMNNLSRVHRRPSEFYPVRYP